MSHKDFISRKLMLSQFHPKLRIFAWVGTAGELGVINLCTFVRKFALLGKIKPGMMKIVEFPKAHSELWKSQMRVEPKLDIARLKRLNRTREFPE